MKKLLVVLLIVLVIMGIVRVGFSFRQPEVVEPDNTIMGFPTENAPMRWVDNNDGPMGFPNIMGFR